MTAAAITGTTSATPSLAATSGRIERVASFALAGTALFGFVLDEEYAPHDNLEGVVVLGSGALAGLVAAVLLRARPALLDRAVAVAWAVVRLVLGYEMIRYGIPKLVGMQFYPQYWRLDERAGDLTPMALAWTFLGRTYVYQAFGGLIEVASGVLVCFRRTALVGACLMTTALLNVVLINYDYDVPVKLFASVYLLFDVAIIARDWRRIRDFFTAPVPHVDRARWVRWLTGLAVSLAIGGAAVKMLREAVQHKVFELEPLEGAWSVDERTGAADPEWSRIYFEKDDVGSIRVGKKRLKFHKQLEGDRLQLSIAGAEGGRVVRGTVAIQGTTVRFEGTCDEQPCGMRLTREFPR